MKLNNNNSTTAPVTIPSNPVLTDDKGALTNAGLAAKVVAELAQLAKDKATGARRDDKTAATFAESHAAFEALLDKAIAKQLTPITGFYHELMTHYVDKDKKEQVKALDLLKKRTVRYCGKQGTVEMLRVKTTGGKVEVTWQPQDSRKVITDGLKKLAGEFCKQPTDVGAVDLRAAMTDLMAHDQQVKANDMSEEARARLEKAERDQIAAEQKNANLLAQIAELKKQVAA